MEILTYQAAFRDDFIRLNLEWLEEYFVVEPHDREVFENVESLIIQPGGEIFFCKVEDAIVGTVAMQKTDQQTFELAKMAVTRAYRGKGLGKILMQACLDFARKQSASRVILLSNTKLAPAIALYRKFNFKEVPLMETDYVRANIQMEWKPTS